MKKIAVLMGGPSSEREVSLRSGAACAAALRNAGYEVIELDVNHHLDEDLRRIKPDVCFNALHGQWGEDGCVQGMLNIMGIPYTHSGVMASALAMDKAMTKTLLSQKGIQFPEGRMIHPGQLDEILMDFPLPCVVKPNQDGSSVGVHILKTTQDKIDFLKKSWQWGHQILIESYIEGLELTTAIWIDRALGVTELRSQRPFYDYEGKYTDGQTQHILPAPIPVHVEEICRSWALLAHQALGCRGVSRTDFRYDPNRQRLVMLEINTHPGMTNLSLVPEQAEFCGINMESLTSGLVDMAKCD